MIRLLSILSLSLAAVAMTACGGSTTRMELRSGEQVRISQMLGCAEYNIDEIDSAREGAPTRRYQAACVEGERSGTFICADGGGCEEE